MTTTSATTTTTPPPASNVSAAQSAQDTANGAASLAGNFNQFLQLLTTQLQNQDPLNPMDSAQFTQQLVQYSQVEQQINTNQKLDNLTTLQTNSALSLALGYVGKNITYTSAEMNFDGSTPVDISYNIPSAASNATANIYDSNNNLVYSQPVSTAAGTANFNWDGSTFSGQAATGTYIIQINATGSDGTAETVATAVTGMVNGIENQNGVPNLLVGQRAVPLSNVINATLPAAATTQTGA